MDAIGSETVLAGLGNEHVGHLKWFLTSGQNSRTHLPMQVKAMAHHSSTLAWKIPLMEEPGGLQFMGLQRVGHE